MAAVHHSTLPKEVRDNLSFWEGKETNLAPLTDRQKDSALELSALSTRREIPDEVNKILHWSFQTNVLYMVCSSGGSNGRGARVIVPKFRDHCDSILEEIEAALSQLHELQRQHVMVSTKTGALHGACEQLLQDQTRLVNMAESISNKLSYFNTLEHLRHKLNSPTLSVNSESFVPLLARLDECISYIASNPQFKESSIYLTRFKQCLNQALSHIRSYIISLLKHATSQVLNNKDAGNAENSFALFYGKFRTCAPRIKSLMEQIEQRSHMTTEYASLLTDCQQCYFEQRSQLLTPCITDAIEKLSKQHEKNPCQLVRSGCSLLIHVCQDEYQLYHHFFSKTCIGLDTLLEGLCNSLYDCLRPVIIHMNHMETLAQLCTILKVEMIEGHVQQKGEELAAFEVIIDQMTEDVQERLVYRAQAYFQTDILMYSPAPGDLAYPDKLLIDLSDDQSETEIGGRKKSSSELPAAPADLQGMWYPTVRRTIVCLSKLDRCISKETFEGLSQEALSACIKSLKIASALITKRKDPINGHLFLIKHLLILREQIAAFDVDFAVKEVSLDFSKMRTAAYGLWSKSGHIFSLNSSNAILDFLLEGAPQLTESYLDSKKEVDRELRVVCEQFIQQVSESFISPLSAFIESVRKVVSETYMMLKSKLPSTLQSMALFLANKDTEYILFKPVKTKVQEYYKQMNELIAETYTEEDSHIIGCPSIQQVSLLLAVS
ncbi:predicted protein [Nematostella vectensis]|uniref:Conserved oligomeric Golgi complex subunit 3 n=1 Tax=Nematostella vectensis TaxID=45351 RepID=A7S5S8_NEMVE|nr:predicted protein [Nematostella vectensis]|eukprot:XP_001632992.1 predicted protein [Nematostella vectensis]